MTDALPSVIASPFIAAQPLPLTRTTLQAKASCQKAQDICHELLKQAPRLSLVIRSLLDAKPATEPNELTLAEMNLPDTLRQRWQAYWQGRAQGTSLSRQQHAQEHYVIYFQAALSLASAAAQITEAQLRPVSGLQNDPEWKMLDGKPITIESPSGASGALVFRVQGEAPQLLYLPGRAAAFSSHATRQDLENQLPDHTGSITYRLLDDVAQGFSVLLDNYLQAALDNLENASADNPGNLASVALSQALAWETAHPNPQLFFTEPNPALAQTNEHPAGLSLFDLGSLGPESSDTAASAQVARQMQLINALSDSDAKKLEPLHKSLQEQQENARQATQTLLRSPRWHSAASALQTSPELLQAHRQGLQIHAQIQQLLGQISSAQLSAVQSIVDLGGDFPASDSNVRAAYPLLKQQAHSEFADSAGEHHLREVLLITDVETLSAAADGPILLYWPGEHGGLVHCPNRLALASCLGLSEAHQSVELLQINGDVLAQTLNATLSRMRTRTQQIQNEQGLEALATELARLQETLEQRLQVPRHAAREAALRLVQEQDHVVSIAAGQANRWNRLPPATCQALSRLLPEYISAVQRSEALLTKDLEECLAFARPRIRQRLKRDFPDYDDSDIGLDLPRSVDLVTDIVAGGTPGTVTRKVYSPSPEREKISLATLLLVNIDETMLRRLNHVQLDLATRDTALKSTLTAGFTVKYLQTLVKELDLAHAYEQQILAAYKGLNDSPLQAEYRRECLTTPVQLMLRMQGLLLHGKGVLNDQGLAILQIAVQADSHSAYQAQGYDIRLLAATLTPGGADTDFGPTTLSGVTFIEDRHSGVTLLYLPEHASHPLGQHASLEAARLSLYERSREETQNSYLASRALHGDPLAHMSRIRQAHLHAFSGVIGVGAQWPATTSLAEHLLNAQMGRAIVAHRASTRSNAQLWMENFTHQSNMIFTYLKLAIGVMPLFGTAIGLYDLFESAARAVNAFTQNKIIEGLEALNDIVLAVIDTAMDVATGIGVNLLTLRQLTRQRQLRTLRSMSSAQLRMDARALSRVKRFAGYEYQQALSMNGVSAATHGRYRGIYRHTEGDFIQIEQQFYQVQWDATAHTWRLQGTIHKGWKRAISLDEYGHWDTHFALHGVHLLGAGAGGGQVIGRLAEQLDPFWPAAIREQLPRFLVDQHYRQQRRVTSKAFADEASLIASIERSNALAQRNAPGTELQASFLDDIMRGKQTYQSWDEVLQISARRNQQTPMTQKARAAKLICERLLNLIELLAKQGRARVAEIAHLRMSLLGVHEFAEQLPLLRQWRQKAIEHLKDREKIFQGMEDLAIWFQRAERDPQLHASYQLYQQHLSSEFKAHFDTLHLMPATLRHNTPSVVAEFLVERLAEFEGDIHRARNTVIDLREVQVNAAQRRLIYEQARSVYTQYKRRLQSTYASFPELFDEPYLTRLYSNLDTLITMSDTQLRRLPQRQRLGGAPSRSPRLFLDTDGHWLVGDYQPATRSRPAQMVMHNDDGSVLKRFEADGERWRQRAADRPTRAHELRDLKQVANQAMANLPSYRKRIQTYQRQGMLAVDVEHMMVIKADDLQRYADRLQQLDPSAHEPARLRTQAQALRAEGRSMRIAQVKQSAQPSEGQLSYLIEQRQVELRRAGQRQMLSERDYLQEYQIVDLANHDHAVLWYAHFHYRSADTPFDKFSAAHLKRAEDRFLGPQWQAAQAEPSNIWRGPLSRSIANQHFAALA